MDHVFNHLEAVYGTKAMVNQLAACLMVTLEKFKPSDLRLQVGLCRAAQVVYGTCASAGLFTCAPAGRLCAR